MARLALASVSQWLGDRPVHQRVSGLIAGQGQVPGLWVLSSAWSVHSQEATNRYVSITSMFLLLSPSPSLPPPFYFLKINGK